jgi:septal ring factor EnvC (AmiA/AmiB activator)
LKIQNLKFKIVFVLLFVFGVLFTGSVWASHCASGDYDCQIGEIQREIDALSPAHENNKKELDALNNQIVSLKNRIDGLSVQLNELEGTIQSREEDLEYARAIFDEKASNLYVMIRTFDPILPFLSSTRASEAIAEAVLQQRAVDGDRKAMEEFAAQIVALNADKVKLE